jgi:NAD-dependent DNA ligase
VIPVVKVAAALPSSSSVLMDDEDETNIKPWNGWTVVFTGTFPNMSRSDAQRLAKELLGAKSTPGTVSKSTNLVVAGAKGGGKKLSQALSLGVDVMDATDFLQLVDERRS